MLIAAGAVVWNLKTLDDLARVQRAQSVTYASVQTALAERDQAIEETRNLARSGFHKTSLCAEKLKALASLVVTMAQQRKRVPASLGELVIEGSLQSLPACPHGGGRPAVDYFYFPFDPIRARPDELILCDLYAHLGDQDTRCVAYADGRVETLKPEEFLRKLNEQQNVAFAKSLTAWQAKAQQVMSAGVDELLKETESEAPPPMCAMLQVDPGQIPEATGGGPTTTIQASLLEQFMGDQVRLLKDNAVLRLALDPRLPDQLAATGTAWPGAPSSQEEVHLRAARVALGARRLLGRDRPESRLADLLHVRSIPRSTRIVVYLLADDRQLAADLVNSVIDSYLLTTTRDRLQRTNRRLAGLRQQEEAIKKQLAEKTSEVSSYEAKHPAARIQDDSQRGQMQKEIISSQRALQEIRVAITQLMIAIDVSESNVIVARWATASDQGQQIEGDDQ